MKKTFVVLVVFLMLVSCTKEVNIYEVSNESANDDLTNRIVNVVEEEPSIKTNADADDSLIIQNLIDNNPGAIIYLEAGTYNIHCPLTYQPDLLYTTDTQNQQNPAGLKIVGDGINNTIFLNKTGDYAIKVQGVKDSLGDFRPYRFQANGYFKNFSIKAPLPGGNEVSECNPNGVGPKGGFMMISATNFTFENIGILGHGSNPYTGNGIYYPLLFNKITLQNEIGVNQELVSQIVFKNPDSYASTGTIMTSVIMEEILGYGLYGENSVGFNVISNNLQLSRCDKGGVFVSGHNNIFQGGAIVACGTESDSQSGGFIIDRDVAVPNGLFIRDIEFDGNFNYHIWVKSLSTSEISNNRFVHQTSDAPPAIAIKLGGVYVNDNYLRNFNVSKNYFRYNPGDSNYKVIELNNHIFYSSILNNETAPHDIENETVFDIKPGFTAGNNLVIHKGQVVVGNSESPSFSVDPRFSSQTFDPGQQRVVVDWKHVTNDSFSNFDNANNRYYFETSGFYSFSINVSVSGGAIGDTGKLELVSIDSATGSIIAPVLSNFYTINSNGYSTIQLSANVQVSAGSHFDVRLTNNSNNILSILGSPNVSNFSGFMN